MDRKTDGKPRLFLGFMGALFVAIFIYASPIPAAMAPFGVYLIGMIIIIGCLLVMPYDWRC